MQMQMHQLTYLMRSSTANNLVNNASSFHDEYLNVIMLDGCAIIEN